MTSRRLAVLAVLGAMAIGLTLVVRTAHAQRGGRGGRNRIPEASTALAAVTRLKCSFPSSATATWEGGEPQIVVKKTSGVFTLLINDIDAQEGTAEVLGLGAPTHVTVKLVGSNLHFLDIRTNGALAITTVFAEESHAGRLKAVHSRSEYVGGSFQGVGTPPAVSQFYGDCEVGSR